MGGGEAGLQNFLTIVAASIMPLMFKNKSGNFAIFSGVIF